MFNRKNQIQDMDAYVEERLSDYLDGTLDDKERQIVEAHLATSESARASFESLRYTVNLLKQTPAPVLPRQFTLPVTSLAPARTTPAWLVWSLRGMAVAATAAFVILLTTTLLRQNTPSQALEQGAPMAAQAPAEPSAIVALASTPLPTFVPQPQEDQDNAPVAPTSSPVMITVEPPPDTSTPAPPSAPAAATNKVQETILPSAPGQDVLPPPPAAAEEPTVNFESQLAEPTPTEIRESTDATAAGASPPTANTPVIPPTNAESSTQRSSVRVAVEGVITATRLRVRRGPGIEYPAIGGLANGDIVQILGRDVNGAWLVIDYPQALDTGIGWIGALFVDESISIETLPIYDAPESIQPETEPTGQSPAPTETPTDIETAEPRETGTRTDVPTRQSTDESILPVTPEPPTATPEA